MACNQRLKNSHYKSAQNAYNNTAQTMAATATPVNVLGVLNTDTGCAIDTNAGGFLILCSGLYRISYDVVFTAGAAGTEVLQGMKDAAVLPCMTAQATVAADGSVTLHAETTVYIPVCCGNTPTISAVMSGVAGTVNHVCASVVKLA